VASAGPYASLHLAPDSASEVTTLWSYTNLFIIIITMPAPHQSVFYRPDALPAAQPTASKH